MSKERHIISSFRSVWVHMIKLNDESEEEKFGNALKMLELVD